jgi:hypothetical protein
MLRLWHLVFRRVSHSSKVKLSYHLRAKDRCWQEKYMNQLKHLLELEADVATRVDHLGRLFTKLFIQEEYEALTTHFLHEIKLLDLELNDLIGIIETIEPLPREKVGTDYNNTASTESTTQSEVSADSIPSISVLKLLHNRFHLDSSNKDSSIKDLVGMRRELITRIWKDLYVLGHLKETIRDLSDDQVSLGEI